MLAGMQCTFKTGLIEMRTSDAQGTVDRLVLAASLASLERYRSKGADEEHRLSMCQCSATDSRDFCAQSAHRKRRCPTSKEWQGDSNKCYKYNVDGSVHQAGRKAIGNAVLDKLVLDHVIHRHCIHLHTA